ncbi:hypothetical protein [Limnovirga soli]|uniref:Lipocalin-like domain-containing protein n=1 Tax=Limnovirga soli TaxID=2656915 RepID=A0A8J8FBH0_9BACT|nr:hypothetical protein [Limnovirga soli]NNV54960.1 hypothetical protein [Limnovirga soli]
MKTLLHTTTFILLTFMFTSCIKVVNTPQPVISPLAGSWVLTSAQEGDANGWSLFYAGVENGIFDLYNDGAATYSETNTTMQGSWYINNVNSSYYDEYGRFYNGPHQQLTIHVSNNSSHSSIDLNFDYVYVYGSRFVATYFNGTYIERYYFDIY